MKRLLYFVLILIAFSSCTDEYNNGVPRIELFLEDSPAEFHVVNIVIKKIELFNGSTWKELTNLSGGRNISILSYTGGKTMKLADQEVEAGNYSKLRLTFATDGNFVKTYDGVSNPLTVSATNSVVELPLNIEITSGTRYVMCDMDVAASIDVSDYTMVPKISVMDLGKAGAISGVVTTSLGVSIAELMYVECVSTGAIKKSKSTFVDSTTGKVFIRLDAGEYNVYITTRENSKFEYDTIENVIVNEADATMLGMIKMIGKKVPAAE